MTQPLQDYSAVHSRRGGFMRTIDKELENYESPHGYHGSFTGPFHLFAEPSNKRFLPHSALAFTTIPFL